MSRLKAPSPLPLFFDKDKRPPPRSPSHHTHSSLGDLVEKHHQSQLRFFIIATSRLCLAALVLVTASLFYFRYPFQPSPHMQQQTVAHAASMSHAVAGWHDRLQPYPGGRDAFHPKREELAVVQIRCTQVQPEGLTLALFAPDVVVDARGVVSTLGKEDWAALLDVAKRAVEGTPQAGGFRNQWRIKHERTNYAIDWLRVGGVGDEVKEVSVYGFDGVRDELEEPVGEITVLPTELKEVFTLIGEARDGYRRGTEDVEVIERVRAVLPADA